MIILSINAPLLRRLHDSEARQRAILDNIADGIVIIGPNHNIRSFNNAAERIFGYSEEEVSGQNVKILLPKTDDGKRDVFLERYLEGNLTGRQRELAAVKKDGTEVPMSLALIELQIEDQRMFSSVIQDITERKEIENQLVRNTVDLTLANEDLARSNKELDNFAYIASHDLKEHLRAFTTTHNF